MKKLIILLSVCFVQIPAFAQKNISSDSLAYQLQRKKINGMLEERRQKFGQYEQSLKMHTGIFGLQTKKDIRRSNDILMDITRTDENIFEQIKILLNYRIFQQQQVQSKSTEVENNSLGYMMTINRLRGQIDKMKQEELSTKQEQVKTTRIYILVFVLMLGSILILLFRKRTVR
ncbi:MAG: hypothetical protein ACTHJ8_02870, partial [Mucilaginibacter sp.]